MIHKITYQTLCSIRPLKIQNEGDFLTIQLIIPEEFQLLYQIGAIGFVISIIITLFLLHHRSHSSTVAKMYAIGSVLTFQIGGFGIGAIYIFNATVYTWTSPVGVIGGYLLIILALIQYWLDRKKMAIDVGRSSEASF